MCTASISTSLLSFQQQSANVATRLFIISEAQRLCSPDGTSERAKSNRESSGGQSRQQAWRCPHAHGSVRGHRCGPDVEVVAVVAVVAVGGHRVCSMAFVCVYVGGAWSPNVEQTLRVITV